MKRGLRWQVDLGQPPYHYNGRGDTPEQALAELVENLTLGVRDAEERVASSTKRLTDLSEYLDEMRTYES